MVERRAGPQWMGPMRADLSTPRTRTTTSGTWRHTSDRVEETSDDSLLRKLLQIDIMLQHALYIYTTVAPFGATPQT